MCGYTGWLSVFFFFFFFIFACFRHVLGLLFVSFSLFSFVFSMFKDRALFPMYQHIFILALDDHDCKKRSHSTRRKPVFR